MSYGGIGVVRELVSKLRKLNRGDPITGGLTLLKRHLPYHRVSDHVLNIAYNHAVRRHSSFSDHGQPAQRTLVLHGRPGGEA